MKKIVSWVVLISLLSLLLPNIVLASEKVSQESFMQEAKVVSKKVLDLVKNGKEDVAVNLPEVKALTEKLKKDPLLAKSYFSSLKAIQALRQNLKADIGDEESKIIAFDDGSFIQITRTTEIKAKTDQAIVPNDPPGIIYHGTDDYSYAVWGLYKIAELHLYTYYDYGNYYVNITSAVATARVYAPAWLVSKSATVVSSTRSVGDFVMQDPVGTFNVVLITDIIPGPYTVTIKHTAL